MALRPRLSAQQVLGQPGPGWGSGPPRQATSALPAWGEEWSPFPLLLSPTPAALGAASGPDGGASALGTCLGTEGGASLITWRKSSGRASVQRRVRGPSLSWTSPLGCPLDIAKFACLNLNFHGNKEGRRPTTRHHQVLAGRGAAGTWNAAAALKGTLVSYKTDRVLAVCPAVTLLSIDPQAMKTYVHTKPVHG